MPTRRMVNQLFFRSLGDLRKLDVAELLPFDNSRVVCMVSIASATFTAVDTVDAAIRAVLVGLQDEPKEGVKEFILRINYVGVARLVFAVGVDAKTVWEHRGEHARSQQEDVADGQVALNLLLLKPEHQSVLFSIERLSVYKDIERGKPKSRADKEQWLDQWGKRLPEGCHLLNLGQVKQEAEDLVARDGDLWKRLVLIELARFKPYELIESGEDETGKKGKSPSFDSKILDEMWCEVFGDPDKSSVKYVAKALRRNASILDGSRNRKIIGAAGTVAIMGATGGVAFAMAPVIAPVLAGSSVAGLSGAALTGASLAAVGYGSLAAGGLGMAGGTAIIAGGGAALGLASGGAATAITALLTGTKGEFALNECAKLLTFCKDSLVQGDKAEELIESIRHELANQIGQMEIQQAILFERSKDSSLNKEEKKKAKNELASFEKSLRYMHRCEKEIAKLVGGRPHAESAADILNGAGNGRLIEN